jgi:PQQ-like domain
MGFVGGIFRLRLWLQILTLALLAVCANSVFVAVAAPGEAAPRSPIQIAALSAPAAAAGGASGYTRTTVASFHYGSGAADLGLRTGSERRPVGPTSFAVGAGGQLFVADLVNGRIQALAADGKQERSVAVQGPLHDLTVDDSGTLYALSTDGALTAYDASTGKQSDRWALSADLAKPLGQLRAQDGAVSLESPDQRSYAVYGSAGPVGTKAQEAGPKKGSKAPSGDYYSTSYRDQGHLYRLDAQGKVVLDVALKLADVASVNFLGEDRSGAAYVVVERFGAKNQVSVEVRKFGRDGALTATISVPPVTFVEMTRSLLVTDSGDIYELLPEANGASILRWRTR